MTRIRREIEIMASLKHKHIVQILEGKNVVLLTYNVETEIYYACDQSLFPCGGMPDKCQLNPLTKAPL